MNIAYYFKNIDSTEAIKTYVADKTTKLQERMHHIEGVDARFSVERQNQMFEITVHADATVFHIRKTEKDMYAAIDLAMEVLNNQIDRYHKKIAEKNTALENLQQLPVFNQPEPDEAALISVFEAPVKPMDDTEAILQLQANKYRFLMFHHNNEQRYSVVMARPDGNYSVVSTLPDDGQYQETVVKLEAGETKPLTESLYPMAKLTIAEAIERLEENNLDYLVFVNDETLRMNLLFHGKHGELIIKKPAI